MSGTVQLPVSVGLGDVAIHIEVPGDLGQGEFGPFQLRSQHDLAAQPGVLFLSICSLIDNVNQAENSS